MREKLTDLTEKVFALCLFIALIGGGVVALLFILALMIGGSLGESLAVATKTNILPWFIRLASLGILFGLIRTYIGGQHALSIKTENKK